MHNNMSQKCNYEELCLIYWFLILKLSKQAYVMKV